VDECPQCGGVWLRSGELAAIVEDVESDVAWMDARLWQKEDLFEVDSHATAHCPSCQHGLALVTPPNSQVQIDICPHCEGIWLDRGELRKILEEMEAELSQKTAGELVRAAVHEGLEVVGGEKGIVAEWKDFSTVMRLLQYRLLSENPKLREALLALAASSPFK
jgi:hypothetical protein